MGIMLGGDRRGRWRWLKPFQIQGVMAVFLSAVLIVALVFGLSYGLAAAVLAFVAYRMLLGAVFEPVDLHSPDTVLLGLFGAAVVITGLYTDIVRRRTLKAGPMFEAARPLSVQASGEAVGEFLEAARRGAPTAWRPLILSEPQRFALSALALAIGLGAGVLASHFVSLAVSLLAVLVAVLAVASLLGGRFGLAAGIVAAPLLNAVAASPAHHGFEAAIEVPVSLVLFAVLGWGVGSLADRLRREREALGALLLTGRDLSASADEAANRRALVDGIAKVRTGAPRASPRRRIGRDRLCPARRPSRLRRRRQGLARACAVRGRPRGGDRALVVPWRRRGSAHS